MRILLVAALLALSGCAAVEVAGVSERRAAREPGCAVEFFTVPPQRRFREIASLRFYGGAVLGDYERGLRARVCELGGEAVIIAVPAGPYNEGQAAVIRWR